jgi:hypothetical protein
LVPRGYRAVPDRTRELPGTTAGEERLVVGGIGFAEKVNEQREHARATELTQRRERRLG